jgi:hypothetical protein
MCQVHYPEYTGYGCTFDRAPPHPARYTLCGGAIHHGECAHNCTNPGLSRGADFKHSGDCPTCKEEKDPYAEDRKDRKDKRRRDGGGGKGGARKSGRRSSRVVTR